MPNIVPEHPKIYHILHIDKLSSVIDSNCLYSDAIMKKKSPIGTTIGMDKIKSRRLNSLTLACFPELHVGDCVPFYFCPRSVMLYMLNARNHPELEYDGGQEPIIHLESDFHRVVNWAKSNQKKWAFTLSNAGSSYAEYRNNNAQLNEINWNAINENYWEGCSEKKQAEFLLEEQFPIKLIDRIGVYSKTFLEQVKSDFVAVNHSPKVEIKKEWYY